MTLSSTTPRQVPLLLAPLSFEAAAARRGARASRVVRIGMGPARAQVACARIARLFPAGTPIGVLGVAGALDPSLRAGDVVVATELTTSDGSRPAVALDADLAEAARTALGRRFPRTRAGVVTCSPQLVQPAEREALAATGALVCEMESAWLAPLAQQRPFVVVRIVVDRPGREIVSPWTVTGGIKALARLRRAATVVEEILGALLPPAGTSGPADVSQLTSRPRLVTPAVPTS